MNLLTKLAIIGLGVMVLMLLGVAVLMLWNTRSAEPRSVEHPQKTSGNAGLATSATRPTLSTAQMAYRARQATSWRDWVPPIYWNQRENVRTLWRTAYPPTVNRGGGGHR